MAISSKSAFLHIIEDRRFLGIGHDEQPIQDRFAFFEARKRVSRESFAQVEISSGERARKVDTIYHYMLDRSTEHVYTVHPPEKLPQYFIIAAIAAFFSMSLSLTWNLAVIVSEVVNIFFEVFQDIYPNRRDEDIMVGLIGRLKMKATGKFDAIQKRLKWIKNSLSYGLAIEAAAFSALSKMEDPNHLFSMKVLIGHVEYLWNRKKDFRQSCLTQLNCFNRDLEKRLATDPSATQSAVTIDLLKEFDWHAFTSVCYIMQCFQSRGKLNEEIDVGFRKFELVPESFHDSYEKFSVYLNKRRQIWFASEIS